MAEPEARLVAEAHAAIGEAPVWLGDRLVWTDPVERRLLVHSAAGLESHDMEFAIWSLARDRAGSLFGTRDDCFHGLDAPLSEDAP